MKTEVQINISEKELDRDIINLSLPELDMVPPSSVDEIDFYGDEMKEWLKNRLKQSN